MTFNNYPINNVKELSDIELEEVIGGDALTEDLFKLAGKVVGFFENLENMEFDAETASSGVGRVR